MHENLLAAQNLGVLRVFVAILKQNLDLNHGFSEKDLLNLFPFHGYVEEILMSSFLLILEKRS